MTELNVGKHIIVVEDCFAYLKSMTSRSIDCVVTSPPYNIGINYHTYHDKKPRDAYIRWMRDIGVEIARVLKPDGAYFLNMGSTNIDPWIQFDVAMTLRDVFVLQNHIVWVKSISVKDDTFGHFKPINSARFLNHTHESIFHFTLNGNATIDRLAVGVAFKDKTNIKRRGHAQDKRCDGNVRFMPYDTVQSKTEKFNHPSGFPLALPEFCLRMHGGTGIVLDPFMGSGTTLLAAQHLGWSGIGIEIDQQYADAAVVRLSM
jgi:site-specific DNA-methyltransferase (adenine-specific)